MMPNSAKQSKPIVRSQTPFAWAMLSVVALGLGLVMTLLLVGSSSAAHAQTSSSVSRATQTLIGQANFRNSIAGWAVWNASLSKVSIKQKNGIIAVAVHRTTGAAFGVMRRPNVKVGAQGQRYVASARVAAGSASAVGKPAEIVIRERSRSGAIVKIATSASVKLRRRYRIVRTSISTGRSGDSLDVLVIQTAATPRDVMLTDSVLAGPPPKMLYDFEHGTTLGWGVDYGGGSVANTTSIAERGSHSLALTLAGKGNVAFRSPVLPAGAVTAGSAVTYELIAPPNAGLTVAPYTVDHAGKYVFLKQIPVLDQAWRAVTFRVPPSTGGVAYLGLQVLDGSDWAGTLELDAVTTEPAPPLVATPPNNPSPTRAPAGTPRPDGPTGRWTLAFHDEFTGNSLNPATWSSCFPWGCTPPHAAEQECYSPSNASVSHNELLLKATHTPSTCGGAQKSYTSGEVTTYKSFHFRYGYIETRFRIPAGKGFWPIIWLLPASFTWPPEVDLLEARGSAPNTITMHYHDAPESAGPAPGWGYSGPNFSTGFHTIGVDVEPNALTWYVDGRRWARFTGAAQLAEINRPMYLLMSLAVGGPYDGPTNSTTPFPAYMRVDYVRAWHH